MGLEDMLKILNDEGALKCREISERAKAEADRLKRQAQEEAGAIKQDAYDKYAQKGPVEANRIISKEKLNSRLGVIQARENSVMKAFESAKQKLIKLREQGSYQDILVAMLDEVRPEISGSSTIYVNAKDEAIASEWAKKAALDVKVEADESIVGGCNVSTDNGDVFIMNDIMSRFDAVVNSTKGEIAQMMFDAEDA